jgi:predicted lipoprotein with Yx(FWY)xxD motif
MILIGLAVTGLAIAGCGGDDESGEGETTDAAAIQTAETEAKDESGGSGGSGSGASGSGGGEGTTIATGESQFGEVLFDGDEQAIYYFDKERTESSECYGDCATAWPPVLTKGEPVAGGGAESKLLGTTERDDGTTQVTYDGRPLYYYVDEGPGQVLCHNVDEFGGLWLAVQPSGAPVP